MIETARYIYCLINSSEAHAFSTRGMEQNEVFTVNHQDLAAVVSPSPVKEYEICRQNLITHQLVMEEAMQNFVVLPVRFSTVAENETAIIEKILKARYGEFKKLMAEMSDKIEMGLKILWKDLSLIYTEIKTKNLEIRSLKNQIEKQYAGKFLKARDKMITLGEKVKQALAEKRESEKDLILDPLKKLAFKTKDLPAVFDQMVLNTAFLLEKNQEANFSRELSKISSQINGRMLFKYVGPVPPCNFVEIKISW